MKSGGGGKKGDRKDLDKKGKKINTSGKKKQRAPVVDAF